MNVRIIIFKSIIYICINIFFFYKQKTAYGLCISDWSSDVCSSDLRGLGMEARVAFDCNVPFTMTIKGARGGLTHTTMPNGQGPYSGVLPYNLAVEMPVRYPSRQMVSRSFNSRQLLAGGVISSNGGIATDGMILAVELGQPSGEAGLLAGDYSETITITVSPI